MNSKIQTSSTVASAMHALQNALRGADLAFHARTIAAMLTDFSAALTSGDLANQNINDLIELNKQVTKGSHVFDSIRSKTLAGITSRDGIARELGHRDNQVLARELTGESIGKAKTLVSVAAAVNAGSSPKTIEALESGKLDLEATAKILGAVEEIEKVNQKAAEELETELLQFQGHADERNRFARNRIEEIKRQTTADLEAERRRQLAKRFISFGESKDGMVEFWGLTTIEVAAALKLGIDTLAGPRTKSVRPLFVASDPAAGSDPANKNDPANENDEIITDDRTYQQKAHDSFEMIILNGLKPSKMPKLNDAPFALVVETTVEDLAKTRGVASISGIHGALETVGSDLARYASCVGAALKVALTDGRIVELQSAQRGYNGKQQEAILLRDGGCIIDGCTVPRDWCEIHHVIEHSKGGPTHTDNGVALCRHHHRDIELNGWEVRTREGLPEIRAPKWIDPERRWRRTKRQRERDAALRKRA